MGLSTLFGFLIAIFSKTIEPTSQGAHSHAGRAMQRPAFELVEPRVAGTRAPLSISPTASASGRE